MTTFLQGRFQGMDRHVTGFAALDGAAFPPFRRGEVWLAGAGPGAPGLLTLLAYHALQSCDVVVFDALVNPAIVAWARPEAERISAGKRGGNPGSARQRDITGRLIELAGKGLRVLRLKGGDPYLYGRGAEEARALVDAGVSFRVIPGIPAGIGGLAYAGIPATNKEVNSSLLFITGHDRHGQTPSDADWEAIARAGEVIVLYMALRKAREIAARLLAAGRSACDPVTFVSCATLPGQQVRETTLAAVARGDFDAGCITGPALVIAGKAGIWRRELDWFSAMIRRGEADLG